MKVSVHNKLENIKNNLDLQSIELVLWPLRAVLITSFSREMVGDLWKDGDSTRDEEGNPLSFLFFLDQRAHTSLKKHCTKGNQSRGKIGGACN